jgi:hypothetical protein
MAVRLLALRTGHTLLPRNMSKPQGLVRPEGLGKFEISPQWGLESATFQLVA